MEANSGPLVSAFANAIAAPFITLATELGSLRGFFVSPKAGMSSVLVMLSFLPIGTVMGHHIFSVCFSFSS